MKEENQSEPKQKKKKSFGFIKFFFFLCLIALIGGGYIAHEAQKFIKTPSDASATAFPVEIKKGSGLNEIAKLLQEKKIISDARKFQFYVRFEKEAHNLKAGTFLLSPAWSPEKILQALIDGDVILHRLTIREGLPWWTVADLLEEEGYCKAEDFKAIIHNKEFLRKYGIPFDSAEGFLYPDTYLLQKPVKITEESAQKIAGRLIDTFWQKTKPIWNAAPYNGKKPDAATLNKLIILASIVERETRVEEERPKVAGVYHNRLKINMILQADPTVIYGLGKEFKGTLLKKHLQDAKNPYNTYKINGLPPGPICSPSLSAIRAAQNPAQHKYYYFVALGIGSTHVFSTNLKDHNRAVQQYRRNLSKQK